MPRSSASVDEKALGRMFGDRDVVEFLDKVSVEGVERMLGAPDESRCWYAEPPGRHWSKGDGRPMLGDEDPAVMQAIGRCAAARIRDTLPWPAVELGRVHGEPCGWCGMPLELLLAACEWATWWSQYLTSERLTWTGAAESLYIREVRRCEYQQPAWRDFFALPGAEREAAIAAVTASSREGVPA